MIKIKVGDIVWWQCELIGEWGPGHYYASWGLVQGVNDEGLVVNIEQNDNEICYIKTNWLCGWERPDQDV